MSDPQGIPLAHSGDAAPGKLRVFTALSVSGPFAEKVATLPRTLGKSRWTPPDDLHITLRFMGDIEPERIGKISDVLAQVRHRRFFVEVLGISCFVSEKGTILYADVGSVRKLTDLCAKVTGLLAPLGFDFGARAWEPHITLARLPAGSGRPETYIKKHGKSLRSSWEATGFHLYRSGGLDVPGRRYESLAWFPFA